MDVTGRTRTGALVASATAAITSGFSGRPFEEMDTHTYMHALAMANLLSCAIYHLKKVPHSKNLSYHDNNNKLLVFDLITAVCTCRLQCSVCVCLIAVTRVLQYMCT